MFSYCFQKAAEFCILLEINTILAELSTVEWCVHALKV